MTKGEAIAVLCDIRINVKWQVEKDAISMAIDALRAKEENENENR